MLVEFSADFLILISQLISHNALIDFLSLILSQILCPYDFNGQLTNDDGDEIGQTMAIEASSDIQAFASHGLVFLCRLALCRRTVRSSVFFFSLFPLT